MFARALPMSFALVFACSACASKKDAWADIDYSKVYRAAGQSRDIDTGYRAPTTVVGCVDDDLYNCH
jgi:hypothetical protein